MEQNGHIKSFFTIILLILFYCTSVYSQPVTVEAGPGPLETVKSDTLNEYIKYALLNNPGLKAAYEKWQAALERIGPAGTLPDPKMTFAYYIEEVETRVGAQKYATSAKFYVHRFFRPLTEFYLDMKVCFLDLPSAFSQVLLPQS